MNKSDITNLLTVLIMAYGYSNANDMIFTIGVFALSGAVTNTLAIYMLFEKVPFLYGSGVIENKFSSFKSSIHNLMMNEFFTKENLKTFFQEEVHNTKSTINFEKVLNKTDFSPAYDSLKISVMESNFGGMLAMFGGEAALEPLKEPFIKKLQNSIIQISKSNSFQEVVNQSFENDDISDEIYANLSNIVNKRLDELSPKMVKEMIQNIIREHLGWLVVWGAILGGIIGFLSFILR